MSKSSTQQSNNYRVWIQALLRIHCLWLHQLRSIRIEGRDQKNTTTISESEFHIEWAISGEF
jgi:hypothetical protein